MNQHSFEYLSLFPRVPAKKPAEILKQPEAQSAWANFSNPPRFAALTPTFQSINSKPTPVGNKPWDGKAGAFQASTQVPRKINRNPGNAKKNRPF